MLVFTDDNFDSELRNNEPILVEFYSPLCGHCTTMAPIYSDAAMELRLNTPPYQVAKVDITANPELKDRFDITSYPQFVFFRDGQPIEERLFGEQTKEDIVNFVLE